MMNAQGTMKKSRGTALVAGLAVALSAFTAVPANAFPTGSVGFQRAPVGTPVEKVGCGRGCAVGVGVAAGVVAGAAIAGAANRNRYYRDNYYYDEPGPVYYRSAPPRQGRCWVETNPMRGTGYWGRC